MFYLRPGFDPGGDTAQYDAAAPEIKTEASEKLMMLRARILRYRDLAATLYNQELAAEVEALARELEEEAGKLVAAG
jgi:8-oxo-dGTP pyrophosphatase MutT (NUDIX family)